MQEWMKDLPDDQPLVLINIPGSHDSCAYYINFFLKVFGQAQNLNITQQLNSGVRLFDIRLAVRKCMCLVKDPDDELITVHGICNCHEVNSCTSIKLTYKRVILTLLSFLRFHPSETIILHYQKGRGDLNVVKDKAAAFTKKMLKDTGIEFNENLTLGQARGKIVYNYNNTGRGLEEYHKKYYNDKLVFTVTGERKVDEVKDLINKDCLTIKEAKDDLDKNERRYPIFYEVSCTGERDTKTKLPFPKWCADFVLDFFQKHEFKSGYYYGWINFDFINLQVCQKIVNSNQCHSKEDSEEDKINNLENAENKNDIDTKVLLDSS